MHAHSARGLMMQEFSAASLEAAKQQASDAFGVPISEISFTVLEEPKAGFFAGLFGRKETGTFRVRAEYTASAIESAAEPEETEPAVEQNTASVESATEILDANTQERTVDPVVGLEKMQIGAEYLEKILSKLAPGVQVQAQLGESGIEMELIGENAGGLIGRRGETLDALQYLVSMVANRGDREYLRISIDTCGYREKRRKALQDLARRICKSVLRTGRSVALEPMNPYERRIIHSTVTEIEGVSSHSSGEEPNRKVIITSDRPQQGRGEHRGRSGGYRGERSERGSRGRSERRPSSEGPRKLDLSTSFEKDYKRPKPEDALNAGVYGKIDID